MMAEDIDKLIVDLKNPNLDVPGSMRALRHAASHALRAQQTRVSELEAERDRIARNRDMWKGQSERQAATIRGLRNSVHTAIIELAALVPNPRCVGNDDWPECLNAADRQCLTDAYDALDAVRNNTDTGPQAQVRAETGVPAATLSESEKVPTASDDLVTEIAEVIRPLVREYAIEGAYPNPPAIARAVLSSPPVVELFTRLRALYEIAEGRVDTNDDPYFEEVFDGSRSILSRFQSVGGDDVDASSPSGSQAIASGDERGK